MIRRSLIVAIALAVLRADGVSPAGRAGDFKPEPGYISLFNGKDFTGWRLGNTKLDGKTETPNKKWHVQDGAIVIDGGGGGDIFTVEDFGKSYHLKLEFRAAPKADSGLHLGAPQFQLQVRDYPTVGPYKKVKFNSGDWNELDVTVRTGIVTTTFNGKAITDKDALEVTVKDGKPQATLNGKAVDVNNLSINVGGVALCKCNGEVIEKAYKTANKGGIGLQSETGKFEFRRIRIKVSGEW